MNRVFSSTQRHLIHAGVAFGALLGASSAQGADVVPANESPLAVAPDEVAPDEGGEAIVVTASRRRDEDVQDVPVAISVISSAALERRGDFTLGQIQQQVPSLQVFSFNPRNTNINIRGLGSIVALSVSISATMSPDATVSPTLTSHFANVPSSIVGESAGILIAIDMSQAPRNSSAAASMIASASSR
jgi:outer membrane receptor protein involved in Fe transport